MKSVDQRMMDLGMQGWRFNVSIHGAGQYEFLEEKFPSKYGHWQIVSQDGKSYCSGFMINLAPWPFKAKEGYTYTHGGVYATLHDCLDECEKYIAAQTAKIERAKSSE